MIHGAESIDIASQIVWVEIEPADGASYLFYFNANGDCLADTWFESAELAKEQARFELEIEETDWTDAGPSTKREVANEDPALQKAERECLALRAKTGPRSSMGVLERAERRLVGAIKRGEPHQRLVTNAERVRNAQLGCFKARDLVVELPTDDDDEQTRRHRENLAEAKAAWARMSADDIIAFYSQQPAKP